MKQNDYLKAETTKFDKRFMNFEDPVLFMNLTDPKGNSEIWKDIYGFDYSLPVDLAGWANTDTLLGLGSSLQVTGKIYF